MHIAFPVVNLPLTVRVLGVFGATAALVVFGVIVDLGMSAGRIHPGVSVNGTSVGGLTLTEAAAELSRRGEELKREPLVLTTQGLTYPLLPEDVGWGPRPFDTAQAAMRVGRDDAPFGALSERARAWVSGIRIGWEGSVSRRRLRDVLDDLESRLNAMCLELDRGALRRRIQREIERAPRAPVDLPVRELDPEDC